MFEIKYGTKAVFRAARELVKHFKHAEKKKGQEWVLANFDGHISEFIMEMEEEANAAQDYIREDKIYDSDRAL